MTDVTDQVREEIEGLHRFLEGWFTGSLEETAFESDFLDRFDPDLLLIPPGGSTLSVPEFSGGLRAAYGSNREFRIAIRNVRVLKGWRNTILATYEEWQRNALASTPPDNGRVATVLFEQAGEDGRRLRWLHIHETWLPKDVMAAGPFDF